MAPFEPNSVSGLSDDMFRGFCSFSCLSLSGSFLHINPKQKKLSFTRKTSQRASGQPFSTVFEEEEQASLVFGYIPRCLSHSLTCDSVYASSTLLVGLPTRQQPILHTTLSFRLQTRHKVVSRRLKSFECDCDMFSSVLFHTWTSSIDSVCRRGWGWAGLVCWILVYLCRLFCFGITFELRVAFS